MLAVYLLTAGLAAKELPRGRVIDRVVAQGDASQSYALYLPSNYTPLRTWPVLYCLDPRARGRLPVERFSEAAEKAGWIVAGSNNSQNGPIGPAEKALKWMLTDTHDRLAIDDSHVYAAGFSGGARLALAWANGGEIAGVIACGAGFGQERIPKGVGFRIFATAGVDDFNYDELYRTSVELAKMDVPNRFMEFSGGHEWLPRNLTGQALAFLQGQLAPQAAQASKEQERLAARFDALAAIARNSGGRSTIEQLRKEAAYSTDSPERRIARRVIAVTFVTQIETSRERMRERQYANAAELLENAVVVEPDNGGAWYSLAVATAAAGNKPRALDALETAAAHGFQDAQQMENEPLLKDLRDDARYRAVRQKLTGVLQHQ